MMRNVSVSSGRSFIVFLFISHEIGLGSVDVYISRGVHGCLKCVVEIQERSEG